MNDDKNTAYIVIWVDDLLLAANSHGLLQKIKSMMKDQFKMKDMGPISYFLGIQFEQTEETITMDQSFYLKNVLYRYQMQDSRPRKTPCEANIDTYRPTDKETIHDDIKCKGSYREIVGSLVYAMTCSRPDLSWVVTKLSQHLENPSAAEWITVKHVLRYIKHTVDYKITFRKSKNGLKLICHSDSDWAKSKEDRRSITGYSFNLNASGPTIAWKSKKQHTVALSSCEAEYMALTHATQELLFLSMLCKDFGIIMEPPTTIYGDNQGSLDMAKNPVSNERSKHIDIKHHFIREKYMDGIINLRYVSTDDNIADLFTKPATQHKLHRFHTYLFGSE